MSEPYRTTIGTLDVVQVRRDGVRPDHAGQHHFFQVGTLDALLKARYDGDVTVGELAQHGTLGIGTLNGLDGELVLLDGSFFQMTVDGIAHPVPPERATPFALVTHFASDAGMSLHGDRTRAEVESAIDELAGSPDASVAIRMQGTFSSVRARSAVPETEPYRPLPEAVSDNQRFFTLDAMAGTMVGFRFPKAAEGVQIPGYHLHLIDDARSRGGHVLDYEAIDIEIQVQRAGVLQIELPAGVEPAEPGLTDEQLRAVHGVEG